MVKYLAFVVLIFFTLGLTIRESLVLSTGDIPDLLAVLAENEYVQQKVTLRQRFCESFEPTLDSLSRGEITLKEATENVRYAAEAYSPTYLRMVKSADPAPTIQESIARNLVGHIRYKAEMNPNLCGQTKELEGQLQKMFRSGEMEVRQ